jgi:hypothetical protein
VRGWSRGGGLCDPKDDGNAFPGYQICGGRKHGYGDKGNGEPRRYSEWKYSTNRRAGAVHAAPQPCANVCLHSDSAHKGNHYILHIVS